MAVTVNNKVVRMTAAADDFPVPVVVKTIRWVNAGAAGDQLVLSDSTTLKTSPGIIYDSRAGGANNVEETLKELYFPFGVSVTTLGSGEVWIYYE